MLPVQQPILYPGRSLPPLYNTPIFKNQKKSIQGLYTNQVSQMEFLQRLSKLNKELDKEFSNLKPNNSQNLENSSRNFPKFIQVDPRYFRNINTNDMNTFDINKFNSPNNIKEIPLSFPSYNRNVQQYTNRYGSSVKQGLLNYRVRSKFGNPICIRREGMLKIRDIDQKDKDVLVTYAVLTKDRLSYFINVKDETSIQGSIELAKIKDSLKLINGFPTCFIVKTLDRVSDCSICAESEDSAREWINAVTQNAVNCNKLSGLNNLNKRGLLK